MSARMSRAFTLLEVLLALGILGFFLVSLFQLTSTAALSQSHARTLTVATLLARSKMADLEQELQTNGFSATDEEESGNFSEEGWPAYSWAAQILIPKTDDLSPEQLLAAFTGLPLGPDMDASALLSSLIPGGSASSDALAPLLGPLQTQFARMVQTLTQQVREIRLTIHWTHRGNPESFELKTHVLSQQVSGMAPGGLPPGGLPPGGLPPNLRTPGGAAR